MQKGDRITEVMSTLPSMSQRTALAAEAVRRYKKDVVAFVQDCCKIKQEEKGKPSLWLPFSLWPSQVAAARVIDEAPRSIVLKARQLGMTWLSLAVMLHRVVFQPGAVCLIVSLRETEAIETLAKLRGMYDRLPPWLKTSSKDIASDSKATWKPGNGSEVHALPSHRGDSYTARFVLIDEASLIPSLGRLLGSIDPTVADSGQICLVSRANKADPQGHFATVARAALQGNKSVWKGVFLRWDARPGRDAAWYEVQKQNSLNVGNNLDQLFEQYPSTIEEALSPSSATTRLPTHHVSAISKVLPYRPFAGHQLVRIFRPFDPELKYVIGVDPAEGVEGGDDSAASVICIETGEQVASVAGHLDPGTELPEVVRMLSEEYGKAEALVERNSIGVATINALKGVVKLVLGPDGKIGYQKNASSKSTLWTEVASLVFATYNDMVSGADVAPMIYDPLTLSQVSIIQRESCKAPSGSHDDAADAWAMGQWARTKAGKTTTLPSCMTRRK